LGRHALLEAGRALDLAGDQHALLEEERRTALDEQVDAFTLEVLAGRRDEVGDLPVERDLAARAEGVGVEQDGHAPLAVAVEHAADAAAVVGVAVAEDERLNVVEA